LNASLNGEDIGRNVQAELQSVSEKVIALQTLCLIGKHAVLTYRNVSQVIYLFCGKNRAVCCQGRSEEQEEREEFVTLSCVTKGASQPLCCAF
jgi:hypothetical protein